MSHVVNRQSGFTLVELMLAMGFVSVLLLAIAMTVIQIGNIYNRGITFKDVNQDGSSIANELQNSIGQTVPFLLTSPDYYHNDVSVGGRLCTNKYSYIWNYGQELSSTPMNPNRNVFDGSSSEIHFVKALDPSNEYCKDPIKKINPDGSIDLLDSGQHELVIHSFDISSSSTSTDPRTGQTLYNIVFQLGTNGNGSVRLDSGTYWICKPPSESGSDPLYCSINQYSITARAGNGPI